MNGIRVAEVASYGFVPAGAASARLKAGLRSP